MYGVNEATDMHPGHHMSGLLLAICCYMHQLHDMRSTVTSPEATHPIRESFQSQYIEGGFSLSELVESRDAALTKRVA